MLIFIIVATIAAILLGLSAIFFYSKRAIFTGTICAVLGLVLVLADVKALQIKKMMSSPMVMPPTTVSSAVVTEEDWAPTLSAVGSISPVQGALVSAELAGVVNKIGFENGATAKKGDLLVQLDASAEEAQLRPDTAIGAIVGVSRHQEERNGFHGPARYGGPTAQQVESPAKIGIRRGCGELCSGRWGAPASGAGRGKLELEGRRIASRQALAACIARVEYSSFSSR